jgi:nickel-dependent lactate racemase
MEIRLPYGHSSVTASLPDSIAVDIIEAPRIAPAGDPIGVVCEALDRSLGEVAWEEFPRAKSVAIAVNDKTRPVPNDQLLPPLLERLASLGVADEVITFFVAVGTHPPMTPDEFPTILPDDILGRYKVVSHDSEDQNYLVYLGETSRGTPVWSNRDFVQSEIKILVGTIEPHQFAGFSGGVKTAAIGLSGLETINRNHSLMTHAGAQLGAFTDNPVRGDVEEIGEIIGIHLALNAILNHERHIVEVLAGEPGAVMRTGIPLSRKICQVEVSQKYALTISSPGGHPKDINMYQAQKGLSHAMHLTQPGGTIILLAACPEGSGSPHYEDWALDKRSYAEVINTFHDEGFRIGPHKAYQIARDASKIRLMTYTGMDTDLANALLLNPVVDLETGINIALADLKTGERVGVLPHAASTIPYILNHVDQ